MYFESRCQRFLGEGSTSDLPHLAVTPHVDGDEVEVLLHGVGDVPLGEVVFDQCIAVGAAGLPEIQYQAPARSRGLGYIFLKVEEALLKPVRVAGLDVAAKLPQR